MTRPELHVAFFRAMNLGHPRCPNRAQLEAAFTEAGAELARSVQTNGTVLFSAGREQLDDMVEQVSRRLRAEVEFAQPVLVRPAGWVTEVLGAFPAYAVPDDFRRCVTVHDAPARPEIEVPWRSRTGNLVLLVAEAGHTLSVVRPVGGADADPNSTMEKLLGVPATTRVTTTLERVRKVTAGLAR